MKLIFSIVAIGASLTIIGCSNSASSSSPGSGTSSAGIELTGAGSTFVDPAMSRWVDAYQKATGVQINYSPLGSGAGISQYQNGTVDFGCTDAPLTNSELATVGTPTVQFPIVSGSTAMAYNLPGIGPGLKLTGVVIANIYLGKVTSWDDASIKQLNPGLNLPHMPISVVHRSDGSGTTFIFTDYLCSVSPGWLNGPGKGKSVSWPVGTGGKGSSGVAALIEKEPGAIGYVELAYADQNKLTFGPIQNKSGVFVEPSIVSTIAAVGAGATSLKKDIRNSLVNGIGASVYPIVGCTYAIMAKNPQDQTKAEAVKKFFEWVITTGQQTSKQLLYGPLPESVQTVDKQQLDSINFKSS